MQSRREKILGLLKDKPGLTDREITNIIDGATANQQPVNTICNQLHNKKIIVRRLRSDGKLGNYLTDNNIEMINQDDSILRKEENISGLTEDRIKQFLQKWLSNNDWRVSIKWGHDSGIDIEAQKADKRWVIEVKGEGKYQQMTANYFENILGEILKRMTEPGGKYSIALPDIKQNRNLWDRLPFEAKRRTHLSVLFIDEYGNVEELFE